MVHSRAAVHRSNPSSFRASGRCKRISSERHPLCRLARAPGSFVRSVSPVRWCCDAISVSCGHPREIKLYIFQPSNPSRAARAERQCHWQSALLAGARIRIRIRCRIGIPDRTRFAACQQSGVTFVINLNTLDSGSRSGCYYGSKNCRPPRVAATVAASRFI